MQLTLLQRPGKTSVEEFSAALNEALSVLKGGLSASAKLVGFSKEGWTEIAIEGEDCEIMQEIISRELGRAQTDFSQVEIHGSYPGIVSDIATDAEVDIGIEIPQPLSVRVSLSALRAQLCDGKPLRVEEIGEHYCINRGGKLTVRITRLEPDTHTLEGWLADSQIEHFSEMIAPRLDRVQVFNCTGRRLEFALRKANLERDVISVEPITLAMHSIVCKLGTDAVGLIPKLGSLLKRTELKPFLPRRILTRCRQW
jgi:hypothetical protein